MKTPTRPVALAALAMLLHPGLAPAQSAKRISYVSSRYQLPAFVVLDADDALPEGFRRRTIDAEALRLAETVPPTAERETRICPNKKPRVLVGDVELRGDMAALEALHCVIGITGGLSILAVEDGAPIASLPRLKTIGGALLINGASNITDLSFLPALVSVGSLTLSHTPALTSLHGLETLQTISGDLILRDGTALTDISALSALKTIGGELSIMSSQMTDLTGLGQVQEIGRVWISLGKASSLHGLESLRTVHGDLHLSGVEDISALSRLETVEGLLDFYSQVVTDFSSLRSLTVLGGLDISNSHGMTSLRGLESIRTLKTLTLDGNLHLESLEGLSALTHVDQSVKIVSGYGLTSLHGLESLQTIGGDLRISGNKKLSDTAPLAALTTVGASLVVTENAALDVARFPALVSVGGDLQITPLRDLSGLPALGRVGRVVHIVGSPMTDLSGLGSLRELCGLYIKDNPALTSLRGLPLTEDLSCGLHIENNPMLTDISPLRQVKKLQNLHLESSPLADLSPLGGVGALEGSLRLISLPMKTLPPLKLGAQGELGRVEILSNPALTSLAGLEALQRTSSNLHIQGNAALTSLAGLSGLSSVSFGLQIRSNPRLKSLAGLSALESTGKLSIQDNEGLLSLAGLGPLTRVTGLEINNNRRLADISALSQLPSISGSVSITNNPCLLEPGKALQAVEIARTPRITEGSPASCR